MNISQMCKSTDGGLDVRFRGDNHIQVDDWLRGESRNRGAADVLDADRDTSQRWSQPIANLFK